MGPSRAVTPLSYAPPKLGAAGIEPAISRLLGQALCVTLASLSRSSSDPRPSSNRQEHDHSQQKKTSRSRKKIQVISIIVFNKSKLDSGPIKFIEL